VGRPGKRRGRPFHENGVSHCAEGTYAGFRGFGGPVCISSLASMGYAVEPTVWIWCGYGEDTAGVPCAPGSDSGHGQTKSPGLKSRNCWFQMPEGSAAGIALPMELYSQASTLFHQYQRRTGFLAVGCREAGGFGRAPPAARRCPGLSGQGVRRAPIEVGPLAIIFVLLLGGAALFQRGHLFAGERLEAGGDPRVGPEPLHGVNA